MSEEIQGRGRSLSETIFLAKRVRQARQFIGISREVLASMLGLPLSEIVYLEEFAKLQLPKEKKND